MYAPTADRSPGAGTGARATAARLSSLDAWRGLTILLMLLVNNVTLDALTPRQLQHAPWGAGITLTDLVFPWFLFCAGAALPFSLAAARKAGFGGWPLVGRLALRTALLYLVGCVLTSAENHHLTLGLGVLQLIALGSFFGGVVSLLPVRWRLAVAALLLLGYDLFLKGGSFTEKANAAQALNDAFLSPLGLRGLLSVIPATALVLLGSAVAQPLKDRRFSAPWLLLGAGLTLTGLGWLWAQHLEFNKTFWTPSYVIYTSGLATLGLLVFWLLADSGRPWSGWGRKLLTPLTMPGRNSLFAYVAPILFKLWVLMAWQVNWEGQSMPLRDALVSMARSNYGPWGGGWLYTLGYMLAVWLVLAYLARRGWTWKL
ncbi:heparan-alpha-glucosaminide N-acetyltransferase domain-containing protein [Deinococcus sp.]|uniref:heparan-alpha-glucosaminide N-acetyltransferase domain-containing protein n=1 Tax=Deinococcus sp. TaxID=47478 RepID=UPI003C7C88EE